MKSNYKSVATGNQTTMGFSLIELLVVIGIIAILAAILFPILTTARLRAYEAQCSANLKNIGLATVMYASDNSDRFPMWGGLNGATQGWMGAVQRYSKTKLLGKCPVTRKDSGFSYWRNIYTDFLSQPGSAVPAPTMGSMIYQKSTVFVMDGPTSDNSYGWHTFYGPPTSWPADARITSKSEIEAETRHSGGANVLFVDTHVRLVKRGGFTTTSTTAENDPIAVIGYAPPAPWCYHNDGRHPWFRSN